MGDKGNDVLGIAMEHKLTGFFLILASVFSLSGAQVLLKSRLTVYGVIPFVPVELVRYLWTLAQDLKVWIGFSGLVLSAALWYMAVSRIPLSIAFPTAALSYPMILIGSFIFLNEPVNWALMLGTGLIVCGVATVGFSQ